MPTTHHALVESLALTDWTAAESLALQDTAIQSLEVGKLLYFPQLAFAMTPAEKVFLSPEFIQKGGKNISFDKKTQQLRGANVDATQYPILLTMMERFTDQATALVKGLFPDYAEHLQVARTSLRPAEIKGRQTSVRKDDKRLHVDAFPSTPNQGKRILRVFSNINPNGVDRVWHLGEPFAEVAERFLPTVAKPIPGFARLLQSLRITRAYRTAYDHYMLHIHDQMKMSNSYQQTVTKAELRLPPQTTWIVQTDHVSHAALSGQHLLEQTFYLPIEAMRNPALSPLRVLEKLLGRVLV